MLLTLLKSKLHGATVTDSIIEYDGSVAIDADLLKATDIKEYEQVDIYNITNGERFTTYAIVAEGGSGTIGIRGAAAHKAKAGDKVIIAAYCQMDEESADEHQPIKLFPDENNRI